MFRTPSISLPSRQNGSSQICGGVARRAGGLETVLSALQAPLQCSGICKPFPAEPAAARE